MLYLIAIFAVSIALSVLPAAELPGKKHVQTIFLSTNPVIAESL